MVVKDEVTTRVDTPINIRVLDNDFDPEGDTLSFGAETYQPFFPRASAEVEADGTITYYPTPGHIGRDYFNYHLVEDDTEERYRRRARVVVVYIEPA